jgi:two-component system response regulator HydG
MSATVLPIGEYRPIPGESGVGSWGIPGAIARSSQMQAVFDRIRRVAPHFRTVLVTGETGTGKELVSRALHELSPATGRLVTLNCSAVVETLFESELFGHVRGAFTGASQDKVGQCEFADGGTLFLDEIGDMPLATQAKLLRVLQNREVQRVGSLSSRKLDLRVVAATNKDLRRAVREHQFREDLYFRLAMVEIHLPALRERAGDWPLLASYFLRQWAGRYGKPVAELSAEAAQVFTLHEWPGNVRELENVLGYACMMCRGDTVEVEDLPSYLLAPLDRPGLGVAATGVGGAVVTVAENSAAPVAMNTLEACEARILRQALHRAGWNQTKAAQSLGTTRDRLRYRMKKYQLGKEQFASPVVLEGEVLYG